MALITGPRAARTTARGADPAARRAAAILTELFGPADRRPFAIRLWDGSVQAAAPGPPARFTLILRRPGALRRMLLCPSELALGEAYLRDDFDVEGDLEAVASLAGTLATWLLSPARLLRLLRLLWSLPEDDISSDAAVTARRVSGLGRQGWRHSRGRDAAAVRAHYDIGNDFYALWLDRQMVYSCAYFATSAEDLDTAQEAKLEYLCRKLRLQPGERLLDIGCGWGGLVQYAAERYGVQAVGITLSQQQAALARRRIVAAGLDGRCRVLVRDYRALEAAASFDKIVSVGMVEHVGRARLPSYFAQVHRLLKPGGLFLNHGIVDIAAARPAPVAHRVAERLWRAGAFIQRYVFPDGEIVPPGAMIGPAEAAGFETRDLESLREHYALTLRHWVRRLEARHADAARLVGEQTYRVWRLYLAASAQAFASGRIGVVQLLLSKPERDGASHLPLTRGDLYRPAAPGLG